MFTSRGQCCSKQKKKKKKYEDKVLSFYLSVHACGFNVRFSPDIKFHREALHVKAAMLRMLTSEEVLCLNSSGHMLVATVNAKLPM